MKKNLFYGVVIPIMFVSGIFGLIYRSMQHGFRAGYGYYGTDMYYFLKRKGLD